MHTRWEHVVKHGEHVDETAAADWSESRNPSSYVCCGQTCLMAQFASVDVLLNVPHLKKKKPSQMNHVLPDFICAFLCFVTPSWEKTPILIINILNITSTHSKISSAFYRNDEFTNSDRLKLMWLNRTFVEEDGNQTLFCWTKPSETVEYTQAFLARTSRKLCEEQKLLRLWWSAETWDHDVWFSHSDQNTAFFTLVHLHLCTSTAKNGSTWEKSNMCVCVSVWCFYLNWRLNRVQALLIFL